MRFGLKETAIAKIQSVLAHYPQVGKAILYGPRARGNYKTGSDIDLTLIGSQELTLDVLYRMMDATDELLLPYDLDLSICRHIDDPDMLAPIRRVGVVFYQKCEVAPTADEKGAP